MTEKRKLLMKKLYLIDKSRNFVFGVLNDLEDDNKCQELMEYIDNNPSATSSDICLISLYISGDAVKKRD